MSDQFTWEEVRYLNHRGLTLSGLLHAAPGKGTVVIVCHGFTGSKEGGGRAIAMADELGKLGYAALLFDFSGCGESEGDFADISLTGHVSDIKSSVDYCLGLGFGRAITTGRSFGGTAALCHGALDKRVAGVCSWAAPADLAVVFNGHRDCTYKAKDGFVPLAGSGGKVQIKETFFTDISRYDVPCQAAKITPCPLLVLHGSEDKVVPVKNAQAIFNAAGDPKDIWIISGADHQFTGRYVEAWEEFFKWLKQNFPVS